MVYLSCICEYTVKYMRVYLCVHMCGVCLSVCFVHLMSVMCARWCTMCACDDSLSWAVCSSASLPWCSVPFLPLLPSSWQSPSLFSPWRAPPASRGLGDCFKAYDSWTSLSSQTSLWSPRCK